MRKITKIRRSVRAISPVIATLLMIAIAVVAALVAYAWIMGYMGSTTHKVGNAILIQSVGQDANGNMIVYVQNVGQGTVTFDPTGSVYINGVLQDGLSSSDFGGTTTLSPEATATINTGTAWAAGITIKIVTTDGTFAEFTISGNSYTSVGNSIDFPAADFAMSTSAPNVGQLVSFTDMSIAGSSTINQWSWSFGDGTTSTIQDPSHAYSTPGAETVTLTVTDANGNASTATHSLTVNDYNSPTASFTFAPTTPNIGQTVTFTDISTQGSGTINQWSWSFGDGASSTAQNPTHAYSTPGLETVTLTVTDINGKTNVATHALTVNDYISPAASFDFSPTLPTIGQTVTFTDTSMQGTGTINQWAWNFGSGATPATSTSQNSTCTYSSAGTKIVTLTVTDTNGKINTATQNVQVDFNAPTADFTMSSSTPNVGQSVTFTDASVKGSGTINQWAWTFGDGGTSNVQNPTHAYSTPGAETVTLTVTDANGKTSTATHSLTVNDYNSPTASFSFNPATPNIAQTVTFTDTSTKGSGTINQWSWSFGDGGTSNIQSPTHAYSTPGAKTVTLTVTDTNGKTSTATHSLTVNDYIPPAASFTFAPTTPNIGQTVTFTDTSTKGSGTINQWSWSFGDGATSTAQNPTHAYSNPGPQTVTLTVTDSNAKTNTATRTLTIVNPPFALDGYASTSTVTDSGTGSTMTLSLTTTQPNDVLYLSWVGDGGPNQDYIVSISSSGTSAWTQRERISFSNTWMETWYATQSTPGTTIITITKALSIENRGPHASAVVFGISGANTASPFDGAAQTATGTSGTAASVSLTTSNAHDFIIGATGIQNPTDPTAQTGFTKITTETTSNVRLTSDEYMIVSTPQSGLSVGFTKAPNIPWGMVAEAIQKAP